MHSLTPKYEERHGRSYTVLYRCCRIVLRLSSRQTCRQGRFWRKGASCPSQSPLACIFHARTEASITDFRIRRKEKAHAGSRFGGRSQTSLACLGVACNCGRNSNLLLESLLVVLPLACSPTISSSGSGPPSFNLITLLLILHYHIISSKHRPHCALSHSRLEIGFSSGPFRNHFRFFRRQNTYPVLHSALSRNPSTEHIWKLSLT